MGTAELLTDIQERFFITLSYPSNSSGEFLGLGLILDYN